MSERARIIQARQPLPDRATTAERIATMSADVREACALVERRLRDHAQRYTVSGWDAEDDAEFTIVNRTVIGQLRLTREG